MKENKTISFSVESEDKKKELTELAIRRGFANISNMARYSLMQYASRYIKEK